MNNYKFNYLAVSILVTLSSLISCSKEMNKHKINFDKAYESYYEAEEALEEGDTSRVVQSYIEAADYGYEPRQAYSSAIYFALLQGNLDHGMDLSMRLADEGFRDMSQVNSQPFIKLKEHPKWQELKSAIEQNEEHYMATHSDLQKVNVVTEDIDNFWNAYDLAKNKTTLIEKREVYLREYFYKGSKGLVDFTFLKMPKGIDQFTKFVETHRPYYDSIREVSFQAINDLSNYPQHLQKVKDLIPGATFPDTYFLMGCHTAFGTVSMNGSLIGLENVVDENTPIQTLPKYRQAITKGIDFLSWVLIHELIHNYQNTSNKTLLEFS